MSELSPSELRALTELHVLASDERHYDLLGLGVDASAADIRDSYYDLSRKFHPDRFYRRKVTTHRELIEEVFTGINRSYELLANETARRRYDLEQARAERERERIEGRKETGPGRRRNRRGRNGGGTARTPADESTESGDQAQGITMSRTIPDDKRPASESMPAEATASPPIATEAPSQETSRTNPRSSIREAAPPRRPQKFRRPNEKEVPPPAGIEPELTQDENTEEKKSRRQAFRERREARASEGRDRSRSRGQSTLRQAGGQNRGKAQAHFDEGKREYEAGNYIKAASSLYLAAQFDPENAEYRALNEEAQQFARNMRALQFVNQAESAETYGKWREALEYYQKAVECNPTEGLAHFRLGQLLHGKADDTRGAVTQFRTAVAREPDNTKYRLSLAEIYMVVGMPRNAEREYQKVLELKPDNGAAKAGLRKARR
jgi:curved DNA-binding protein CbpA